MLLLNCCPLPLNAYANIFALMLYYLYLALAFYIHIGRYIPVDCFLILSNSLNDQRPQSDPSPNSISQSI
jgi:hypothetical protein